jgi:Zn-dependent protease
MEPTFVMYLFGFVLLVYIVLYGFFVKTLLGLRLKKPDCQAHDISELPSYLHNIFAAFGQRLQKLGFAFSHCQLIDEPVVTEHSKKWNLVLVNNSSFTYANMSVPAMPDYDIPIKIEFNSFFDDGHILLTTNGTAHEIIHKIPDITLCDGYAESLEKQYQLHLDRLSQLKLNCRPVLFDPAGYAEKEKTTGSRYIEALESEGWIKTNKDYGYQITLPGALKHAFKALAGNLKVKNMRSKARKYIKAQGINRVEIPVEAEASAFLRMKELMQSKNRGYIGTIAVCVISILISMFFFKMAFDITTAVIIVLALGFHEFGHYIGMRMFGHKDVNVLFLPFGAVTIGSGEDKTSAMQRIIIYFLGPVPGLILGTILIFTAQVYEIAFLRQLGIFLLILNYINLLPILPLDGGRVVDLALFSHFPVLKVIFLGLSVFLLALGGLFSQDKILLIFAIGLGMSILPQIRKSILLSKLKRNIAEKKIPTNDQAIASEIFTLMKQGAFAKMAFSNKFQSAKGLLSEITKKPATVGVSLIGMFLYGASFIMPLIITIVWAVSVGLIGGGGNYNEGIVSFVPDYSGEYVFVTRAKNLISNRGAVFDKNGHMKFELKKNIGFINPELTWRKSDDGCWVAYQIGGLKAITNAQDAGKSLILRNINTEQEITVNHPVNDVNTYIGYQGWSSNGRYLFGTKITHVSDSNSSQTVFRMDVITGDINEIKIGKSENYAYTRNFLPEINSVILCKKIKEDEDEQDFQSHNFTLLDLTTSLEKTFELGEEVGQWEVSGGGTLIYLEKIFKDGMVKHQLVSRNLKTSEQKVLMPAEALPEYSFEDAAKDKKIILSFNLSPKGNWIICRSSGKTRKSTCWLVNVENGKFFDLLTYDEKEHYANIRFSTGETKLCAVYTNLLRNNYKDKPSKTVIEFYDINPTEIKRVSNSEIENQPYAYNFLGDERFLYIKSNQSSRWKNTSELHMINVKDGSNQPFIQNVTKADKI